ncbi:MAG TPA: hypothetical protein VFF98_11100 [Novosphingobium sp.]|nr:hypothetical protein [Novosphingobium sp.]
MARPSACLFSALFFLAGLAPAAPALAAPEEIQVYTNEINDPGEIGLELHANTVPTGNAAPDHAGGEGSTGRLRLTPEWSLGLGEHFELGAYVPLMTLDDHGAFRADGFKVRLKWLGRHAERGVYYGLNYEIGREDIHLDQNAWNNEVKLIGGWEGDRWLIGSNVNFDFALSGPAKGPPDVEWTTKLAYKLHEDTLIGVETYNGMGSTARFGQFGASDQSTFATFDTRMGIWDLNLGIGRGYGSNPDHLILKMIIGLPIGHLHH